MLTTYKPALEDLWFKQQMMADEETMSYNHAYGGTIAFPQDLWRDWYDRWIAQEDGKRFYRYVRDDAGEFVGEIAYHYDEEGICLADVVIYARYRGMGLGGQALELLLSSAKENRVPELYDDIAIDNPSASLFVRHGFEEVMRTEEVIRVKKVLKE